MSDFYTIYTGFYVLIVGLYLCLMLFLSSDKIVANKQANIAIILVSLFFICLFGSRELSIGADTFQYFMFYLEFVNGSLELKDFGFTLMVALSSLLGESGYFYILSAFFILPFTYIFLKIEYKYKLFLYIIFITQFSFLGMGINILRQGIGISFMFLACYLYYIKYKKLAILMFISAISLHLSLLLYLPIYVLSKKITIKISCFILVLAVVLSLLPFNLLEIMSNLPFLNSRLESYTDGMNSYNYSVGFRLDFLMYNFFYIAIGIYFSISQKLNVLYPRYNIILIVFILMTAFFVLAFKIPYSDRFGLLSWVLIPAIVTPIFICSKIFKSIGLLLFISINSLLFVLI